MNPAPQTFSKDERLRSKKIIEQVVGKGQSFSQFPFRTCWKILELNSASPAQVAISVPKKFFKRAVDRNRIKRLVREVYRKNKSGLYTLLKVRKQQCAVLLIYTGRTTPDFKEVEKKIILTLHRLEESIQKISG